MSDRRTRNTIVRLLSNMASQKEVRQYLKRFSEVDQARFAVVKVGGAILRDELPELASALSFLQRVGLTPVVIHGAGPQLNAELSRLGIESRFDDGMRVTRSAELKVVRRVMQAENLRLVEALQSTDTRATSVINGVFEAELLDSDRFGLVGKVNQVHTASLNAALKVKSIPVISCLGETEGGQIVNINADIAANELVRAIQPYKVVFLTGTGGLLDGKGEIISSVNLSAEYTYLISQEWVNSGMEVKLRQIHDLLMDLPHSSSVSITTPAHLTKELFTHRGAGTLVRRGEEIQRSWRFSDVDCGKLRELIESAFGRTLDGDYFETAPVSQIYLSETHRAGAVLTDEDGVAHLDKFAVAAEARGEGLGRALWQTMRADNPALFWRARRDNAVNSFYFEEADGCIKEADWIVFWYGLSDMEQIKQCVAFATAQKATI